MPSVLGNLLFLSLAFALGLVWFTLFLVIIYRLFFKETSEKGTEMTVDEVPIDQETVEMEEIPLEI